MTAKAMTPAPAPETDSAQPEARAGGPRARGTARARAAAARRRPRASPRGCAMPWMSIRAWPWWTTSRSWWRSSRPRTGPLSVWLGEKLAAAMRENLGLTRLAQLATYVNEHGTTWHEHIPSLGARSRRAPGCLAGPARRTYRGAAARSYSGRPGPARSRGKLEATRRRQPDWRKGGGSPGAALQPAAQRTLSYGLVPLEDLDWPVNLLGEDGEFRGPTVNAYRATNDREAQQAWVQKAVASMALPSQVVVHRAIERLVPLGAGGAQARLVIAGHAGSVGLSRVFCMSRLLTGAAATACCVGPRTGGRCAGP
jgi:hypothetical protein